MATLNIKDWQGESAGETELDLAVASEANAKHIVYLALRRQMANQRQSNAHSKTRAQVRGGGRKPWRQKGTGRARAGSIRSPLWRKGGVIFGPSNERNYKLNMNRKERRLALRTAFQGRSEDTIVVQDFADNLPQPKTKEAVAALDRWGVGDAQSALVIIDQKNDTLYRSFRNIPRVKLITATNLNVFDLLNVDWVVVTVSALARIQEVYSDSK